MERLRVQSLIQRLRRQYGDDEAWAIVQEAFEIEMRVPEQNRRQKTPPTVKIINTFDSK